ncbi:hypothetical protein N7533_006625 [Penicillium manginii]|jgi:hypothetical protein|uniref:uncharacterized protein n=1 Tax=Penicillium manginii TaxID=203109 RepID=UPI002546BAF8|nr:uncharacterized protein N7533_006625 [Penicillium manginii]KAJ5749597.1 hypothetical protein N7533_006625 [Penicillium manginii]
MEKAVENEEGVEEMKQTPPKKWEEVIKAIREESAQNAPKTHCFEMQDEGGRGWTVQKDAQKNDTKGEHQ